jgi:hypothetical protein
VDLLSKDITTEYTKDRNKRCGRKGYCAFKREKITDISPRDYGVFLQRKRKQVD